MSGVEDEDVDCAELLDDGVETGGVAHGGCEGQNFRLGILGLQIGFRGIEAFLSTGEEGEEGDTGLGECFGGFEINTLG